jgi:outer membrane protein assembly factor BamB
MPADAQTSIDDRPKLQTDQPLVNSQSIFSSFTNPLAVTPVWSFSSFENYQSNVNILTVDNGLVYVEVFGDSPTRSVYCLNADTGNDVWSNSVGGYNYFDYYVVSNGYVFAGEVVGKNGVIACLNATDGQQVWSYVNGTGFGIPIVVGGIVYGDTSNDSSSSLLYAFNASTGSILWERPSPPSMQTFPNSLITSDGRVFAIGDGLIYAFDAYTGENLWNNTTPAQVNSFTTDGSRVYVGSNNVGILAFNASNGSVAYNYPIDSSIVSMVVANNNVYAECGNGYVYAINSLDGKLVWRYSTSSNINSALSINGYFYVCTTSSLSCLDAYNGALVWDFKESSLISPTYSDGIIYVGEGGYGFFAPQIQHSLYALDATTGKILWSYSLSNIELSCTVYGGTVYVAADYVTHLSPDNTGSGAVYALKPLIASLQLLPVTLWESTVLALRITVVIAVIAILTVVFVPRKKLRRR